ncbi:hypothetical protein [Pseudoteredinibacter isoporae]|uniref:hypothetical protein n=1 Tax=Pseudoteredinibacter isoporae TaxID=570281 RepID=UPI0031071579
MNQITTVKMDLVIDTDEYAVDMKAGLDTMQGVSDAMRIAAETVLSGKTPTRNTSKGRVRTKLRRTFDGSYGQEFHLEIYDQDMRKSLRRIGRAAFIELITYVVNEAIYQETAELSEKAKTQLDRIGNVTGTVVRRLQGSILKNIHQVSRQLGYGVTIRHRTSRLERPSVVKFDSETAKVMDAKVSGEKVELEMGVTRLNIHTGNGRLQIKGHGETVAFGFQGRYRNIAINAKKVFSENLNKNNGLEDTDWEYLRVGALPMKLADGTVVKYFVTELYEI